MDNLQIGIELGRLQARVQALEAMASSSTPQGGPCGCKPIQERDVGVEVYTPEFFGSCRLHWGRWKYEGGFETHISSLAFAGTSFRTMFDQAMRLLFIDQNNASGLVYNETIYHRAMDVIAWNGGRRNGFTDEMLRRFLLHGLYRYLCDVFTPGLNRPLVFERETDNIYASAYTPGGRILINPDFILNIATTLSFPSNATGIDQIQYVIAATVLHEIMHNHGASHPDTVDYAAGSDYASSLPFVAEQAVFRASPYWSTFQSYYSSGSWLVGGAQRVCVMR